MIFGYLFSELIMFSSAIKVQYSDISIYAICMVNKKLDMIYIKITGYFLLD